MTHGTGRSPAGGQADMDRGNAMKRRHVDSGIPTLEIALSEYVALAYGTTVSFPEKTFHAFRTGVCVPSDSRRLPSTFSMRTIE